MKILIAVEQFDPAKGYLEYYLARELTKIGHDIYVFTFGGGKEVKEVAFEEFHIVNLPSALSINGYHFPRPSSLPYLLKFLKNKRPDMVHCQPIDSPISLFFLFYSKLFGYKISGSIMTQLNIIFSPWTWRKKVLFCLSRTLIHYYSAKRLETLFAKSHGLVTILSRSYGIPKGKFSVIPLGTDPDMFRFKPLSRKSLRVGMSLNERNVVIVYSGKLDCTKGIDILLKALAPIIEENDNVKLLVIGRGKTDYFGYLNKLIDQLDINKNVIFRPWANQKELCDFYSASDIGVWPGLSSISIVDAASTGLPIIIADSPVESFAIANGNGFSFEIGNVNELRSLLKILIYNKSLRETMGKRSRLLIEERLNWKTIAHSYINAYSLDKYSNI